MKKILIFMAVSVDGYIAGPQNETPWCEAEWENYKRYLNESSCLIIGRTTYEMMAKADEFNVLDNPRFIVVSSTLETSKNDLIIAKTPEQALDICRENKWDKNIIVGGGTKLNSYFLNHGLATHLHLDIEPIILSDGLKLFDDIPELISLEREGSSILSSGTVSVDYKIRRGGNA